MNTVQRIAKNTAILLVSTIISKVLGFFYVMYTARYLGAEGFGILSFALAFTGIFGVFADLGFNPLTVREVARDKSLAKKYLNNISVMKAILVTITFALIAIVINLLGYPEQTIKVVYLISLSVVFNSFTGMFYSVFQAFEKMEYQSLGQILNSALMLSGVMIVIKYNFTIIGFASLYLMASIIILGYSLVILRWKFSNTFFIWSPRKIEIDWSFWKTTILKSLPFAFGGIFLMIYFWIDRVMLSLMEGDTVVGYYSAAYNLVNVLSFIPSAFVMAIYPVMSNYFKSSGSSLSKIYQHSVKYMYMLALPIAVGTMLLSKRIIYIIYGSEFFPSTQALNILIWAEFFVFMNIILGQMLFSINKENKNMFNAGVGALLNVVLNLLLIPKMSFVGAAIATVTTELYFFIFAIYFISKAQYKSELSKVIPKPLLATLIMGLFVHYFIQTSLFILIPISALIYFIILYLTGYWSDNDIKLIKQLLTSKSMEVD